MNGRNERRMEAERSVIGCCLLGDPAVSDEAASICSSDDFEDRRHRHIFAAIETLVRAGKPIDLLTVKRQIGDQIEDAGGAVYLASLCNTVPTAAHVAAYAKIVRDLGIQRRIVAAANSIALEGTGIINDLDRYVDRCEALLFAATNRHGATEAKSIRSVIKTSLKELETVHLNKGRLPNIVSTGYRDFDDALGGGLHRSDLIVLAARPSMGKTAYAVNIAANVAIRDKLPVLVFSLEMSDKQIGYRMMAAESRCNIRRIARGQAKESDWSKLAQACCSLADAPLDISDGSTQSVSEIRSVARKWARRKKPGIIVIDYLQLIQGKGDNRSQEIGSISRGLKGLARELDVPVLALSQLNRSLEQRANKRPMLSDLRESGDIEQDADVVVFLYRDSVYQDVDWNKEGLTEVIIGKQRNGPTCTIKLMFHKQITRFDSLAWNDEEAI